MEEISSFCKKVEVSKARCDCVVNYSKGQINTQGDPATGIVRAQPRRHDSEVENRLEGARICGSYPSDREGWRCLLRDRWMDIVEIFLPRGGAVWLRGSAGLSARVAPPVLWAGSAVRPLWVRLARSFPSRALF